MVTRMARQRTVKWIAIVDLALALLSIFYETLALTLGERRGFKDGAASSSVLAADDKPSSSGGDTPSREISSSSSGGGTADEGFYPADNSTRLLAYVMMACVIYGLFLMQTFMAAKLFVASKRMRSRAVTALQKFSCWRIWSCIFIFLLIAILVTSVVMNVGQFKWSHWLLYTFLLVQILFRAVGIYYVGLCRKDVKDGLVHPAFLIDARHYPPPPPPLHLLQPQDL